MDVHSKEIRSYNMSMIRCRNTKPELLVRKFLHSNGYRYRINSLNLPGKPDIVLKKYNTIIFVHGCFWHGHHNCKYFKIPETRTEWWKNKIESNRHKDKENEKKLKRLGWKIIIIWECQLRPDKREKTLTKLPEKINL